MFGKRRNSNKIIRSFSKEKSFYITKTELEMDFIVIITKSNIQSSNICSVQWTVLSSFHPQLQLSIVCLTTPTISEICVMSQYKNNIHFCIQSGFLWPVTTFSETLSCNSVMQLLFLPDLLRLF